MDIKVGRTCTDAGERAQKTSAANGSAATNAYALILALLLPLFTFSQKAQLEITSTSKSAFFVAINDSLSGERSQAKHLFTLEPGLYQIKVITDNQFVSGDFQVKLEEIKRYKFELGAEDDKLSLLPIGEAEVDTATAKPEVKKPLKKGQKPPKPEPLIGRMIPGITLDSLLLLGQLKTYTGKVGCSGGYSEAGFKRSVEEIKSKDFERQKLELTLSVLNQSCVSIAQLSQLLDFFEFDETRLQVVKAAKGHILDPGNVSGLEKKISLSENKVKLKALVVEY